MSDIPFIKIDNFSFWLIIFFDELLKSLKVSDNSYLDSNMFFNLLNPVVTSELIFSIVNLAEIISFIFSFRFFVSSESNSSAR